MTTYWRMVPASEADRAESSGPKTHYRGSGPAIARWNSEDVQMTKKVRVLAIGLTLASALLGDTLVLRNGSRIAGRLLSAQRGVILFAPQGAQNRRFNMDEVARIEFNGIGDTQDRFNSEARRST